MQGEGDEGPGASASSTPTPGGFTNHVFRSVLDPRVRAFGPRIRDLPSKRLYVFERAGVPKHLRPLVGGKVNVDLIRQELGGHPACGGHHGHRDHAAEPGGWHLSCRRPQLAGRDHHLPGTR